MSKPKVLIIYTGGTIGMIRDEKTGTLKPFRLQRVVKSIPSILKLGIEIHAMELDEIIDSSNVTPDVWVELATIIGEYYEKFDGFVVLHGSDTMAHSASALSFLLENLAKPVILTGSQLPIGLPRTDARENLITALEIAAMRNTNGESRIPEVCIYFEDNLYRGNRTHKFNSENFDAFLSPNYHVLAEAGVKIEVFDHHVLPKPKDKLVVHTRLNSSIAILKLFPGIDIHDYAEMFIKKGVELVILESYGSGNGPTSKRFLSSIKTLVENNVLIMNVTQCREGHVEMGKYESSTELSLMGVINGSDMTTEATVAKAMFILGLTENMNERRQMLETPLRGEMTV
jgi:L-asparaginase